MVVSKYLVFACSQKKGSCLFFSGNGECAYSNTHTVSCGKRVYDTSVLLLRQIVSPAREWLGKKQHSPEQARSHGGGQCPTKFSRSQKNLFQKHNEMKNRAPPKNVFCPSKSQNLATDLHPNNYQKPEIANKNPGKRTCQYGQPGWVWVVSKLTSWFSFSGVLVNVAAWSLFLEIAIQSRRFG